MQINEFAFGASWIVESDIYLDGRGSFRESFRRDKFLEFSGIDFQIEQSNCSVSSKGVLRGIHYSVARAGQVKWVSCLEGEIQDYVVDLRVSSPTFGQWKSIAITSASGKSVVIGNGIGHAFEAMTENSIVAYSLNSSYEAETERTINPFDVQLAIQWKVETPILSNRDRFAPSLNDQISQQNLPNDIVES
jgi:dTDP-4-dehydrorhamnose 3,5-epimerase